jgi:hypothetical protein
MPDRAGVTAQPFALVLAIWGTRYGAANVNGIVSGAFQHSPNLDEVVLLTDRPRVGLDPRIRQLPFFPPYNEAEFIGHGYRAKLAVFAAVAAQPGKPSVFLDLDTIVVGDLGRIARLVTGPNDLFMLPPAGLRFSPLRRWLDRVRGGDSYPVGNSSVLAFHSAAEPNLARLYAKLHRDGKLEGGWSNVIDDHLISWFGRGRVRAVPTDAAVMLRREFLSRLPLWPALKASLPQVRKRRSLLSAVTMNGVQMKPETLAGLAEGAWVSDGRGRHGRWDVRTFGVLWQPLREACRNISVTAAGNESD